ncbi:MAG: AAA family ATPase, partial [Planctomycetota bacterium]|nr:AAA family ATPase [Planctomycetota bacterium]
LQLLDDGRLTDGQGRTVDFTQTLVLLTSNLRDDAQVQEFFRPELLNRLDDILTFDPLERDQIRDIVDVQIRRLADHVAGQDITLEVSDAAKDELARQGWNPAFGARPLKRAIQKGVTNAIAEAVLAGTVGAGQVARVDWSEATGFTVESFTPVHKVNGDQAA